MVKTFSFALRLHRSVLFTARTALPVAVAAMGIVQATPVQAQRPPSPQSLTVVSYAVTKTAYDQIFKLFAADWKKKPARSSASMEVMEVQDPRPAP